MCEYGIIELPREFLKKLMEMYPQMKIESCNIDDLTDDECRMILRAIYQDLCDRENLH